MVFIDIEKKKKKKQRHLKRSHDRKVSVLIESNGLYKKKKRHFAKQVSFYIGRADQILNSMRFRSEFF